MFVPRILFGRILFHFEIPEDGGGAPAAVAEPPSAEAGAEPPAGVEPGADAAATPAEPSSAEAAAPAWSDSTEFTRAVQETAAEIAQEQVNRLLDQFGGQQQEPADPYADLDLSDPQALVQVIQQVVRGELAPLQQITQKQAEEEGQQRFNDIVSDFTSREGEFLSPDKATPLVQHIANVLYGEEAARYGEGARAAEASVYKAAALVRDIEQAAAAKGAEQHVNHLATLAGAPESGTAGAGAPAAVEVRPQYRDELEAARAFAARQRQV